MNVFARSTKPTMIRFALVVAATAMMGLLGTTGAQAADTLLHQFEYDPAGCNTDAQGKVYIALGQNVFAFRTSGTWIAARYGNDGLTPPDAADAEGCPGHPAQMSDYVFPYEYRAAGTPVSAFAHGYAQADVLRLISLRGKSDASPADATAWQSESFALELAQSICSKAGHPAEAANGATIERRELPSGFTACRLEQANTDSQLADERAAYIAHAKTYQTPLGRPFVINCGDQTDAIPDGRCDVNYVYAPGLAVSYQFHPSRGSGALPIDQIIAFDRGLRAAIAATLVKDYPWPGQPEGAGG